MTYEKAVNALVAAGLLDKTKVATAVAAYVDAATALVAAELIDEANAEAVPGVIADVWVVDSE